MSKKVDMVRVCDWKGVDGMRWGSVKWVGVKFSSKVTVMDRDI